jgi:PST family polysaccharide transporter
MAVNNLLLAIVNGKKEVVGYVIANISGSIISVLLTGILALSFGLYGALVAFAVNPAVVLIATALLLRRMQWFRLKTLLGKIDSGAVRELFGFAIMGGTSALALPLAQILIRDQVVSTLGLNVAGFWQASWKISELYLMLVTTTLSVYYLPRLAEIRSAAEMKIEITKVYGVVLPLVIFGAGMIYILRDFIISLLFTPEFLPMRELFPWQLTGDVIKIGSWVIAYVMLGRAMVKTFVVTEIAFAIVFYCLSILFIGKFGIVGVPLAYAATYLGYWMLMAILLKSYVGRFESVT